MNLFEFKLGCPVFTSCVLPDSPGVWFRVKCSNIVVLLRQPDMMLIILLHVAHTHCLLLFVYQRLCVPSFSVSLSLSLSRVRSIPLKSTHWGSTEDPMGGCVPARSHAISCSCTQTLLIFWIVSQSTIVWLFSCYTTKCEPMHFEWEGNPNPNP